MESFNPWGDDMPMTEEELRWDSLECGCHPAGQLWRIFRYEKNDDRAQYDAIRDFVFNEFIWDLAGKGLLVGHDPTKSKSLYATLRQLAYCRILLKRCSDIVPWEYARVFDEGDDALKWLTRYEISQLIDYLNALVRMKVWPK